jgi:hypothetical protein
MKLNSQYISLIRELISHQIRSRYLGEIIEAGSLTAEKKRRVASLLEDMGQRSLDAFMHRLQTQVYQLKYLQLDSAPTQGRYDLYISNDEDVGTVLQRRDEIAEAIQSWVAENSNVTRVELRIARSGTAPVGGITVIDPGALDRLSQGRFLRSSNILNIEPLKLTPQVQKMADALRPNIFDTARLVQIISAQFLIPGEVGYELASPVKFGLDAAISPIIQRERNHHPVLGESGGGGLDDLQVIIAYTLAVGGLSSGTLSAVLASPELADSLREKVAPLALLWPSLPMEILNEDVCSLRQLVGDLVRLSWNKDAVQSVLAETQLSNGTQGILDRFHLEHEDVVAEVEGSRDPDFGPVLGLVHGGDDINVILACALLYAGFEKHDLSALSELYDSNHPTGVRLVNVFLPAWDALRRSVLEKRHELAVSLSREDILSLSGLSGTWAHRFLAVRVALEPVDVFGALQVVVEKLPRDCYLISGQLQELDLPAADELVGSEVISLPPGFNIEDFHINDLFGRSILSNWLLRFDRKGDRSPLPAVEAVEAELVFTYVE